MTDQGELGRFLRARREQVKPADVGLPAGNGPRRTPGLRREELATLAGVSIDYYTRLERGRETHPSPAVLDALARVLQLDEPATEHLHALASLSARPAAARRRRPACRVVRPTALLMLETLRPSPAYVVSRTNDLLAANPGGLGLFPGITEYPPEQRNLTRYFFLHPRAKQLWRNWEGLAAGAVAHLRAIAGADPDDPEMTALVGELIVKSDDFARLWSRYEVRPRSTGLKCYDHPIVGDLRLSFESMPLAGTDGQRIVVYLAEPGTPDHDAMVLLDLAASQPSSAENDPGDLLTRTRDDDLPGQTRADESA